MKRDHEKSSGNVFADLGLPDSGQEMLKAKLTVQIYRLIKARGLTQAQAAALLGTTQPQMSALMRLRPTAISVGRPASLWRSCSLKEWPTPNRPAAGRASRRG